MLAQAYTVALQIDSLYTGKHCCMSTIISPHDKFFKAAMTDKRVATEFFNAHLPEPIKQAADFSQLQLCAGSYIDAELKTSFSDLLFSIPLAGYPGYLYTLVEHQSTPDKLMPFRLLKYLCAIWQQHIEQSGESQLPLIYPLVFYHGQQPYPYSTDIKDLIAAPQNLIEAVWGQPFQLIDTHILADDELKQRYWSGIMEYLLKYSAVRDILPYLQAVQPLLYFIDKAGAQDYISRIVRYVIATGEVPNQQDVIDTLKQGLSEQAASEIMTIAEQLRQQGYLRGISEGEAAILTRQLQRKFGTIPEHYLSRIRQADANTLLIWGEQLLFAESLPEIFTVN